MFHYTNAVSVAKVYLNILFALSVSAFATALFSSSDVYQVLSSSHLHFYPVTLLLSLSAIVTDDLFSSSAYVDKEYFV